MQEQVGVLDNLTIQDTEECGIKVALIWTTSKGAELQQNQKDLIMRQFYAGTNHQHKLPDSNGASVTPWVGAGHTERHPFCRGHLVLGRLLIWYNFPQSEFSDSSW